VFLLSFCLYWKGQTTWHETAPTSLKAIVGPWNNSNKCLFHLDNRESKHSVSAIISFSTGAGISSPINCLIASKAISSLLKFLYGIKKIKKRGYSFWKIQSFIRC
jgi:hypothetical protein